MAPSADERRASLEARFKVSASERLERILVDVGTLEQAPGDRITLQQVRRELHTLKGEASVLGLTAIAELVHMVEDLVDPARALDLPTLDLVQRGLDLVGAIIGEPGFEAGRFKVHVDAYVADFGAAGRALPLTAAQEEAQAAQAPPQERERLGGAATARIATERLDFLTAVTGGLLLRQAEVERNVAELKRLVKDLQKHGEREAPVFDVRSLSTSAPVAPLTSSLALDQLALSDAAADVIQLQQQRARASSSGATSSTSAAKALSGQIAALTKEMDAALVRLVDESFAVRLEIAGLQEAVSSMRLLPLAVLFDAAPTALRELCRETKKRVRLVAEASGVAVDKQVLDVLDPVLLHLLRNAVDHGIESVDERRAAFKPEEGTFALRARQVGPSVEIEARDDGRGIDIEELRAAGVRKGLFPDEQAAAAADRATLLELPFLPGFSTRTEVTGISGRGVGLDVVQREVQALGGSVRLEGERGRGCVVTVVVPISVALTRVLVCAVAEGAYAFPAGAVERVMLRTAASIERAGGGEVVDVEGRKIPLFDMTALLGFPAAPGENARERIVILDNEGARIALSVERVLGEREVVQRALDPIVRAVDVITGTCIVDGARLVLVANVPALFATARRAGGAPRLSLAASSAAAQASSQAAAPAAANVKPRILIVDDSELTRDMLVHLAGRLGMEPWEAADGHDAIQRLAQGKPDIILTDLDMPVVDGIGLLKHIRASPSLRELPVIVLSTRGSAADKRKALEAGANAYLVKAAFSADELRKVLEVYVSMPSGGR